MKELPQSLAGWSAYPQFVLCDDKVPVDAQGTPVNPHAPEYWMSADMAIGMADSLGLGVGFVFTKDDPFWFLDIDHCSIGADWSGNAHSFMNAFAGCAMEISTSGEGLHIFGTGEIPPHSSKNKEYGIELYTEGRFVLLTGNGACGDAQTVTANGPWLVENYFPPKEASASAEWRSTPVPEWNGITEDAVLIAKLKQQTKFGGKASVADLMAGNVEVLAANYGSLNDSDPYDRSSADQALANHLAFWTGKNHNRIWIIMCQSGLLRDKWTKHKNYLKDTIIKAVDQCQNVYGNQPQTDTNQTPDGATIDEGYLRVGGAYMSPHQLLDHFKDCCYVTREHGILVPSGAILKPDQFKAVYGGYSFGMSADGQSSTKNAWEGYLDNQAVRFPRVDGTIFIPTEPYRKIIIEDGQKFINTHVPLNTKRVKGDVTRFTDHMHKLFPDQNDYAIIMAYMSAMVQYQGTKFQWCPVIQGAEGNGKTLINRCIEAAIGSRYCHSPKASDLSGGGLKFNGWLVGKTAIFIEEIFGTERFNLIDSMKPMITNDRIEIQFKGRDQYTAYIVANIMMFSNHKDAIKITNDQRRFWIHYCPQQTEADLWRDGMGGKYFVELYDWLKRHDGYAMVAEYLWTYSIPQALNPAQDMQRAPASTSKNEAVLATMGPVEQHILEAVEEGRQGFCGDYISSKCLDILLRDIRADKLGPRRRNAIMESLGYFRHPWLNDGRVNEQVLQEGSKPIIYYKGELPQNFKAPDGASLPVWVKTDYELKQGYLQPGEQMRIVK
jgi:hypothetical protein